MTNQAIWVKSYLKSGVSATSRQIGWAFDYPAPSVRRAIGELRRNGVLISSRVDRHTGSHYYKLVEAPKKRRKVFSW